MENDEKYVRVARVKRVNEFVLEKLCAVATFQYAKLQTHIAAFKKYV